MKKTHRIFFFIFFLTAAVLQSCREEAIPKPPGYFRIDLPAHDYSRFQSSCEVSLDVPNYARVEDFKDRQGADSCWFNISYPRFNATIYCTYFGVNNNVNELVQDAYTFAMKHEMKASGVRRTPVEEEASKVFGIIYDIDGEAASQVQFFVTDSVKHFFRGSLYFNNKPNPDSIAPVLNFVREDIAHMLKSVKWESNSSASTPELPSK
ncbi:MAG: gliding motility lipoprotein GldD [Flavobacteriales bacterium]